MVYSVFGLLSFISNVPLSGTLYDSLFMSHPKITYLRLSESDWWKSKKFRPRGLSTRGYQNSEHENSDSFKCTQTKQDMVNTFKQV